MSGGGTMVDNNNADSDDRILPSTFMRKLRPEYYSDTEDHASYVLDAPTLEYHLDTITSRNQTHDFELFCRKLCERAICPNLKPQTGPEGGGDSKADTETYAVAPELAMAYIGEPAGASERWAFAFSAKQKWAEKVRKDVSGLVETGRPYGRIICVTSRFARAKDRALLEDELSKEHRIPITIHDRSWIVKETIEADRKDLAFNYLKIGEIKSDPLRLGPQDYSRARQLADLEASITGADSSPAGKYQQVTEALIAAKLSRSLEQPRTETDGRFTRALRLADANGSYHQQLEARYEWLWTSYWWFDDVRYINTSYPDFEQFALRARASSELDLLGNIIQLLSNSIVHRWLTPEECDFTARAGRLRDTLEHQAADTTRPNNALEAKAALVVLRMNTAVASSDLAQFPAIWSSFRDIFDEAEGLGEFDADTLMKIIDVAGQIAGADREYSKLVERMAEFVSNRRSSAEGAIVLLKRATKLDLSNKYDILRLLGKAIPRLNKREYSDHFQQALQLLMLAYKSAGLCWAARSAAIFSAASNVVEGEREGEIPVAFFPSMLMWGWIASELRYFVDCLSVIRLLNGAFSMCPLSEDSKALFAEDMQQFDLVLGSQLLTVEDHELSKLEMFPDLLAGLGLSMSRSALLYRLGYVDQLKAEGWLSADEQDKSAERIFSRWAGQPAGQKTLRPLLLNEKLAQRRFTSVLGLKVVVAHNGGQRSIELAEMVLAGIDAFFATAIEFQIAPHIETFECTLSEPDGDNKPEFLMSETSYEAEIVWPTGFAVDVLGKQGEITRFLVEIAGTIMGRACLSTNLQKVVTSLISDDTVIQRVAMVTSTMNSQSRATGRSVARMDQWTKYVKQLYPPLLTRPSITPNMPPIKSEEGKDGEIPKQDRQARLEMPTDHRRVKVSSVIDREAWDQAEWKGAGYAVLTPNQPCAMALLFRNEHGARRIFEGWLQRFGHEDEGEEIAISLIRGIDRSNPSHYGILIGSRNMRADCFGDAETIISPTRSLTMEPKTGDSLNFFQSSLQHFKAYYIVPAVWDGANPPAFLDGLAILKREVVVKDVADVAEDDFESLFLKMRPGIKKRR